MRSHWSAAASALGLRHLSGGPFAENDARFRDVLLGSVNGQHILVRYLSNFDVQKPETLIQVASEVPLVAPDLDRQGLVARCATLGVALDPETAEWFLGHRDGIGTCLSGGVLVYRQLYEMSADQLIRLISAMAGIMPHLGRTPTGGTQSGGAA